MSPLGDYPLGNPHVGPVVTSADEIYRAMIDPPRRMWVFTLEAEETEEFSVTCTGSEAAELVETLQAALPDVAVTADRIAQTDYSTETESVEKIAAAIVADTGFISPAEPA